MWAVAGLLFLTFQVDHAAPDSPVAGLLELPEVFGEFACDRFVPETVDVYAGPSVESARLGFLETTKPWYASAESDCEWIEVVFQREGTGDSLPLRFAEYSYEEPGLVVVERSGDWFRIESGETIGWLRPRDPERYHSYEQLVQESLAYVRAGWRGTLWDAPGVGIPVEVPPAWRDYIEPTVEVLESSVVEGELWFRIRLDREYGCGSLDAGLPTVGGWLRGYRDGGANQIWFYSRGC